MGEGGHRETASVASREVVVGTFCTPFDFIFHLPLKVSFLHILGERAGYFIMVSGWDIRQTLPEALFSASPAQQRPSCWQRLHAHTSTPFKSRVRVRKNRGLDLTYRPTNRPVNRGKVSYKPWIWYYKPSYKPSYKPW